MVGQRKSSYPSLQQSEDTDLKALHKRFKVMKPQSSRKDAQQQHRKKTIEKNLSSTENELSIIHQQFNLVPRSAAKPSAVVKSHLPTAHDQQKRQSNPSRPKLAKAKKSGPGSRPDYSAPSLQKRPASSGESTTPSESSSASSTRLLAGVLPAQQNSSVQTIIEISSSDSDSLPNDSVGPTTSSTGNNFVKPTKSDSEESSESESNDDENKKDQEDVDEDMKALDFQISNIPSSQSYVAAQSEISENSNAEDKTQYWTGRNSKDNPSSTDNHRI